MASDKRAFILQTLGPGLLFAGAAVGVSHLVQSTRAGAEFGFGLLLVVIGANALKYPAFSFAPRYTAATGTSLLEGYRRQGVWALILYALVTLGTMFVTLAVVTLVTAGLAKSVFQLSSNISTVSLMLMLACGGLLVLGKYHVLEGVMKVVVAAFTVMTLVATALVMPEIDWGQFRLWPSSDQWNITTALFVAGLAGWMPSPIDLSIWHSLWALAKRQQSGHKPSVGESMLDFNIGYIGTGLLAICFLTLGVGVLYGSGVPIEKTAAGFATQVIGLYTATLGDWSRYLIGGCAFAVMFSTTLTVTDGFPRVIAVLVARFRSAEEPEAKIGDSGPLYWGTMALLLVIAYVIIDQLIVKSTTKQSFILLVDIATALSFVTAPILAILNHRVVFAELENDDRPSQGMRMYSLVCIAMLSSLALAWVYVRFLV